MEVFLRIYNRLREMANRTDNEAHARALRDVADAIKVALAETGYDIDSLANATKLKAKSRY